MKLNIINFVAILIFGIGSLSFTDSNTVVLNNSCEAGYELECDRDGMSITCCSICSSNGEIANCKTLKLE